MRLITLRRLRTFILGNGRRKVLKGLVGVDGVNVVFEPVQAGGAIGTDAGDQRSKVCGVGESEEGKVQVDHGENVGLVVLGAGVFLQVAAVQFGGWSVEGGLACIGDCGGGVILCCLIYVTKEGC